MSKIDLKNNIVINDNQLANLASKLNLKYFKVSSKENIGIDECFDYLATQHYKNNGCCSHGLKNIADVNKISNRSGLENIDEIEEKKEPIKSKRSFKLEENINENKKKEKKGCC